jgi:Mn2+/Fe2+ NRAMP family transporter
MVGYAMNFFHMSPVKALVYSAAFNGIVAPPLIVVLLFICNNRKVVGNHTNGPWSNVFGWATVVLMAPAAAFLIYSSF